VPLLLRLEIKRVFNYKDFSCVNVKRGFILFIVIQEYLCRQDCASVFMLVSVSCVALVLEGPYAVVRGVSKQVVYSTIRVLQYTYTVKLRE
jgi:hypothetical protein